uniref:Uncharacterized protein n=1 Tax=Rhizophora mucronata TaxID=61149 RepID=A0A2P2IJK7_RHIMU
MQRFTQKITKQEKIQRNVFGLLKTEHTEYLNTNHVLL